MTEPAFRAMTAVIPELRRTMAAWLANETVGVRAGDLAAVLDAAELALNAITYWSTADNAIEAGRQLYRAHNALRPLFEEPRVSTVSCADTLKDRRRYYGNVLAVLDAAEAQHRWIVDQLGDLVADCWRELTGEANP